MIPFSITGLIQEVKRKMWNARPVSKDKGSRSVKFCARSYTFAPELQNDTTSPPHTKLAKQIMTASK